MDDHGCSFRVRGFGLATCFFSTGNLQQSLRKRPTRFDQCCTIRVCNNVHALLLFCTPDSARVWRMNGLTRGGTAEPYSRAQFLRRERGQGKKRFFCSADHQHDWQPYRLMPGLLKMIHCTIHSKSTTPFGGRRGGRGVRAANVSRKQLAE